MKRALVVAMLAAGCGGTEADPKPPYPSGYVIEPCTCYPPDTNLGVIRQEPACASGQCWAILCVPGDCTTGKIARWVCE